MEFKDLVLTRRSVRSYQPKPIEEEKLQQILEAGLYAPSAVNFQPWYYAVIKSPTAMKKLATVMSQAAKTMRPALEERFAKHPAVVEETTHFIDKLGGAPVCILAFQHKPEYSKTPGTIVQSVAAGIENILLAAWDLGIGSCWLTAPLEAGVDELLRQEFAPDKGSLVALITLGYPEKIGKAPVRKEGRYDIL